MRAVPRLCEFYPGICLTNEEKARKNLSQVKKNLIQSTVYILPKHPQKHTHYKTHKHTLQNTQTHTHITKQYKTTTVQIKTNTVHDTPKWINHNIIKCQQYKLTIMYIALLSTRPSPTSLHFTSVASLHSLHFKIKSLHINHVSSRHITTLHITSLIDTQSPLQFPCL